MWAVSSYADILFVILYAIVVTFAPIAAVNLMLEVFEEIYSIMVVHAILYWSHFFTNRAKTYWERYPINAWNIPPISADVFIDV